jgi:hypothetical protein
MRRPRRLLRISRRATVSLSYLYEKTPISSRQGRESQGRSGSCKNRRKKRIVKSVSLVKVLIVIKSVNQDRVSSDLSIFRVSIDPLTRTHELFDGPRADVQVARDFLVAASLHHRWSTSWSCDVILMLLRLIKLIIGVSSAPSVQSWGRDPHSTISTCFAKSSLHHNSV